MNPGLFAGEQIKALRENPFTDFVSVTTIRFTVEFKEMFVAAMDSGKTIRSIFRDSGYDPDVLGRERMKSFAHRVRKEQRKNGGFHNGYKERKQHPDLADYASMPQFPRLKTDHTVSLMHDHTCAVEGSTVPIPTLRRASTGQPAFSVFSGRLRLWD